MNQSRIELLSQAKLKVLRAQQDLDETEAAVLEAAANELLNDPSSITLREFANVVLAVSGKTVRRLLNSKP